MALTKGPSVWLLGLRALCKPHLFAPAQPHAPPPPIPAGASQGFSLPSVTSCCVSPLLNTLHPGFPGALKFKPHPPLPTSPASPGLQPTPNPPPFTQHCALPAFSLLLHNKFPQNSEAQTTITFIISPGFGGTGIWERLSWAVLAQGLWGGCHLGSRVTAVIRRCDGGWGSTSRTLPSCGGWGPRRWGVFSSFLRLEAPEEAAIHQRGEE